MKAQAAAKNIVRLLTDNFLTLAVAESCTGGLLAKLITDVSGASKIFIGGIVCYSNEMKRKWLGVDAAIIEHYGAVSRETVEQMVKGLLRTSDAKMGISVTGIAGPTGGTLEKPVGTVFIAAMIENILISKRYNFKGDRETIRNQSAEEAFTLLQEIYNKYKLDLRL